MKDRIHAIIYAITHAKILIIFVYPHIMLIISRLPFNFLQYHLLSFIVLIS